MVKVKLFDEDGTFCGDSNFHYVNDFPLYAIPYINKKDHCRVPEFYIIQDCIYEINLDGTIKPIDLYFKNKDNESFHMGNEKLYTYFWSPLIAKGKWIGKGWGKMKYSVYNFEEGESVPDVLDVSLQLNMDIQ